MLEAYRDFNEKRMFIFQEMIKAFWNNLVKDNSDLEELAINIKNKYGFENRDLAFI
ncbi:MAG: iron hydrogenase, partial [Tissierellia bacterium]|nr:iron hydrogenase [Tissierellia bacterium]